VTPKLSLNARRLIVGLASLPVLVSAVSYYGDLNWFERFGGLPDSSSGYPVSVEFSFSRADNGPEGGGVVTVSRVH
jgi:hypothetical protein